MFNWIYYWNIFQNFRCLCRFVWNVRNFSLRLGPVELSTSTNSLSQRFFFKYEEFKKIKLPAAQQYSLLIRKQGLKAFGWSVVSSLKCNHFNLQQSSFEFRVRYTEVKVKAQSRLLRMGCSEKSKQTVKLRMGCSESLATLRSYSIKQAWPSFL